MLIERKCPFTGKINVLEISVTKLQLERWANGISIQDAMPTLTADEREFIMTGITASEWDKTFPDPDNDSDAFAR